MDFAYSDRCKDLQTRLLAFMDEHIYPNEKAFKEEVDRNGQQGNRWVPTELVERLKPFARQQGLWNLFLPPIGKNSARAPEGLSNLDYAPLCEIMGRVAWAPEVFNCSAPDTGNMETLERYGLEQHKQQWLEPLLKGEIRSAFAMTEPDVASSDATNVETRIERDGDEYLINGHKWWISGAGDPRCKLFIVMGKTDPSADRHRQQSMILVPRDTPGITIKRPLPVFGYDDAPHGHCEILFENVRVPASSILLGDGRKISEQGVWRERIAESRIRIDTARLLTLKTAWLMDTVGNKQAQSEIAMIKVLAPSVAQQVLDWAIQAHGAAGVSDDFPLAYQWAGNRTLRLADGPDEVHRNAIAKLELTKYL
jgi:acyl-CoA dehydrogenase